MSTESKDGGPAFPTKDHPDIHDDYCHGMTLRDWFAGQALAGLLADPTLGHGDTCGEWADRAYKFADAMLAARAKEPTR